jgi:hypothetical protein
VKLASCASPERILTGCPAVVLRDDDQLAGGTAGFQFGVCFCTLVESVDSMNRHYSPTGGDWVVELLQHRARQVGRVAHVGTALHLADTSVDYSIEQRS